MLIWTLGEILDAACAPALIAGIAPEGARGRYLGIYGIRAGIGFAVGPPLGAWLLAEHGENALWFTCLVVGLVLAVVQCTLAPALRRRQHG